MQTDSADMQDKASNVLKWVISSGLVAALLGVWGTLFGLLHRTGWLTAFGVSPDVFLPSSVTDLTFWSYLAMLDTWSNARTKIWIALIWCFFTAAGGLVIGISLALIARWLQGSIRNLRSDLRVQATFELSTYVGVITLAPLALILVGALLLFPPLPAFALGKAAATRAMDRHLASDAAPDRCHRLVTSSGPIGTCPMVIAQTADRIAFLDGETVTVIPAVGVQISWKVPGPTKTAN